MSLPFAPPSVRDEEPQIALFIESATRLKGNSEKVERRRLSMCVQSSTLAGAEPKNEPKPP